MADQVVTRTYRASILNCQQVSDDLDSLGFAASKLWNIGRWTIDRIWSEVGHIPTHTELCSYLKSHERYADLHSQSSQRVLQELTEAFRSWYDQSNSNANPPGYRKRGSHHPRSTISFKNAGFNLDTTYDRVRLSKGRNLKEHHKDFVLCEFQTRPDIDLSDVESVQQVRAVWNGKEWELHFVCRVVASPSEEPGDRSAGIDLGVSNVAAVSFGDETVLYPGNAIKEDRHYFKQKEYETEGENGPSRECDRLRKKKSRRQTHFLHAVSKDVVKKCVERDVGTIAVGHPKHIRQESEWGRHGNKRLHDWPFDRFIRLLEYKAEERGISVERVDEAGLRTSKTCCCCGIAAGTNRVERGLYVCDECGLVANADLNAAENMRATVTPNPSEDRSNGCLAQPAVRLFDKSTGRVAGREQVVGCEP